MGYTAAPGQIPILCGHCGGAAEPEDDGGGIVCPYCGTRDRLPPDELGRALELKRRVTMAARSAVQLAGLEGALGRIFEQRGAFVRVAGPWLVLFPLITAYMVAGSWSTIERAPANLRLPLALYAAMGPMWIAGIALAFGVALFIGRIGYRRGVRPLLYARPPRQPGLPTRCRGCAADLPDGRGPFITCSYCSTQSLVTPEIQRDRERLLAAEEAACRARASGALAATGRAGTHMSRTLVAAFVVIYAGVIGLAAVASRLIPH